MSIKDILIPPLKARKSELEKTISQANHILKKPIYGHLEVCKNGNSFKYYIKEEKSDYAGTPKRKYIKDIATATAIANKDYADKIIKAATKELKQINSILKIYSTTTADEYFSSLSPGRQMLISPLIQDDEEYSIKWLSTHNNIYNTYPKNTPILTENNEMVRSKSEKIIADRLKLSGIPYKYEEAVSINGHTIFPDFAVLNKKERRVLYWEHFGMIDNPDYLKSAMSKMDFYLKNKILPGKNLIITYETSSQPVSVQTIKTIISEYLL